MGKQTASVILLSDYHNHILLLKRHPDNVMPGWAFPGGKIEEGESALAAVKRELEEETGIKLKSNAIIYRGFDKSADGRKVHLFQAWTEDTKVILSGEHVDYAWTNKPTSFKLAGRTFDFLVRVINAYEKSSK